MDEFSDMIIYAILLVAGVFFSNRTTRIKDSTNNNKPQTYNINSSNNDSTDEILKFKKLLDEGAITQEEFDAKKKELLNL
ncbi:short C-terminal domain protein [Clostridioides difficile CD9]|nr:short C-terminal domain protein [Clostridioides difficile CD9]